MLEKVEEFDGFNDPREEELYEFNIPWFVRSKKATVYWLSEAESIRNKTFFHNDYSAAIQLEDGYVCSLYMRFDRAGANSDGRTDKCRVDVSLGYRKEGILYSGAEYTIYNELQKREKQCWKKWEEL